MTPFRTHTGIVVPIERANVDTDQIIPKQYLKSIHRTGFGVNLFDEWRYLDAGEPGRDHSERPLNPQFVLNQPRYAGASVLLAGRNFGCGSSREHAPWALAEFGFRALIAPSFADIFFNNCCKNGLLPVVLDEAIVASLFEQLRSMPGYRLTIDLEANRVVTPAGVAYPFELDAFRRDSLLDGWDEIGRTLRHEARIRAFEAERLARLPWLDRPLGA